MSEGVLGALSIFTEGVCYAICDLYKFLDGFFHDLIVDSSSIDEHLHHLQTVLQHVQSLVC